MTLGTPALLFGSIALIMLAYTNRFFVLAKLIRDMHSEKSQDHRELNRKQIPSLRLRIKLVQGMQALGVLSFLICTCSMFCIFINMIHVGEILFGVSVLALMLSLLCSLWEVLISTKALNVVLNDFADNNRIP
ncbi:DUF2721 domain-containing protein [Candidatus Symbiobacter mobilis]|uniref:DUF2721 domain-containing protein n=1 Tax=Candidatus Symbiobacter mobilis CR TaxID=946483 RepID=U5N7L6_9BURK|nr:DUF2721 domain-containing protein [Candidatus Symbiobacter mobilis]AGX87352.1 hypothetical protein Cenrod_1260 [Candidatus Symbiobacter mobilis CR]